MNITQNVHEDIVIIGLDGDVMGGPEAVKLNTEINNLLDSGSLKAIIDLGSVNRMNSSGLGILINAATTYNQNGGKLKLANSSPLVQNLLTITKLDSIFDAHSSVEEAIASF
ncbi:MAG: STAS domain-containing protein [Calditrichia bacterium]